MENYHKESKKDFPISCGIEFGAETSEGSVRRGYQTYGVIQFVIAKEVKDPDQRYYQVFLTSRHHEEAAKANGLKEYYEGYLRRDPSGIINYVFYTQPDPTPPKIQIEVKNVVNQWIAENFKE